MKRLLLVFLFVLMLSGCVDREEEFTTAMANMKEVEQMKLAITIRNLPIIEQVMGTITIDHNKTESVFLGKTSFKFEENGTLYSLVEYRQAFYLLEEEVNSLISVEVTSFSDFVATDFEYRDGYYYSIAPIGAMQTVRIELEEGYMVELRFTDSDGVVTEIDFTGINRAIVTLPEYITMEPWDYALFPFRLANYQYEETDSGFRLVSTLNTIEYDPETDYYVITGYHGDVYHYYPETHYIAYGENVSLDVSIYLQVEEQPVLSESEFADLDELMTAYNQKAAE